MIIHARGDINQQGTGTALSNCVVGKDSISTHVVWNITNRIRDFSSSCSFEGEFSLQALGKLVLLPDVQGDHSVSVYCL